MRLERDFPYCGWLRNPEIAPPFRNQGMSRFPCKYGNKQPFHHGVQEVQDFLHPQIWPTF